LWTSVADLPDIYENAKAVQTERQNDRFRRPLIRLWDGNWVLRGVVTQEISADFVWLLNESCTGKLVLPFDYYLAQWAIATPFGNPQNIHVTVDKNGARWGVRMQEAVVKTDDQGIVTVELDFLHDYEELKHICLARGSLVLIRDADGHDVEVPIEELTEPGVVLVDGQPYDASASWSNGVQQVSTLTTESGKTLTLTPDHRVLTPQGWKQAQEVGVGGLVITDHGHSETVASFESSGETEVFDLSVPVIERFIAQGVTVHNCVWSNPLLPAIFQFPKDFILAGPSVVCPLL